MSVFISKQPIFNRYDDIVCYELFYRDQQFNKLPSGDTSQETIELLNHAFLSIGIQRISNNMSCFIQFPQSLIMSDFLNTFEHEKLIIELGKDIEVSDAFITRICELKSYGFKISIAWSITSQDIALLANLLQYIDFYTVDFAHYSTEPQILFKHNLHRINPNIRMLARNVQSRKAFEEAQASGYLLFQGDYFMEPETISTKEIPAVTTHYMELLNQFYIDDPDIGEISEIIEQDVSLSYKILQLSNSASNQLNINITSIRQAIMLLGLTELQKWIYLLAMRENSQFHPDIERELLKSSLMRAKICEQLARNKLLTNYTEYYLVGMFSNIDSVLARPMAFIMEQLPFSDVIKQTLLEHNTDIEPFLQLAVYLDKLQWDKISESSYKLSIPLEQIELIYSNATSWVDSIFQTMDEVGEGSFAI